MDTIQWHMKATQGVQIGTRVQNVHMNTASDTEAPFFDLHQSISNGFVSSKIYYKRDDFDFDIVFVSFFGWRCSMSSLLWSEYFSAYKICQST